MVERWSYLLTGIMAFCILILPACEGGKSTNGTGPGTDPGGTEGPQPADFFEYREFVERISPPVFVAPSAAPAAIEDWTEGSNPLLAKVFSEQEPMSIYANLDRLDMTIATIEGFLMVTDSGTFLPDSATVADDSDAVTVERLDIGTAIPTGFQEVLGALRIDVDYLARVVYEGPSAGDSIEVHIGFTRSDSAQRVLTWSEHTSGSDALVETFLFFADADRTDSTVVIRGLFFKDNGDQTTDRWVYHIENADDTGFSYRMSWYTDDLGGQTGVASIIGGGHKDVEFALRYRQFTPANSGSPDAGFMFDQTFGPNFTAGDTTIASSYDSFVDEQRIFRFQAFPQTLIVSPWVGLP